MSILNAIADAEEIAALWADSTYLDSRTLQAVLDAASEQVVAYAPTFTVVTSTHKLATILQAKHIWSSLQGNSNQTIGPDGFLVNTSTWNLVLEAQRLLRPKSTPWAGGF